LEDEPNEQHKSIIETLNVAAPERTFEQINFEAGKRGAGVEDNFYDKLERLNVPVEKRDKILAVHVQCICEAHDTESNPAISKYMGRLGLMRRRR